MPLSRRLTLTAPLAALASPGAAQTVAAPMGGTMCVLMPQSIEGPFYIDPKLVRADIAERRPGVKLRLALNVVEAAACRPISGARVDVWHADAQGLYSGFRGQGDGRDVDTTGQHFLRGTQLADDSGSVTFETIWPGWYAGRATHIHFKVFLDARNVAMGQIYFPDALNEYLYANVAAYGGRRGTRDVVNRNDALARNDDPEHIGYCAVSEEHDGYRATLTLGVDREATARDQGPPGSGRLPRGARPDGPPSGGRGGPPRMPPITDRPRALVPGIEE
jgi:protocatechuate 3,4-dioxygenase beta subunit